MNFSKKYIFDLKNDCIRNKIYNYLDLLDNNLLDFIYELIYKNKLYLFIKNNNEHILYSKIIYNNYRIIYEFNRTNIRMESKYFRSHRNCIHCGKYGISEKQEKLCPKRFFNPESDEYISCIQNLKMIKILNNQLKYDFDCKHPYSINKYKKHNTYLNDLIKHQESLSDENKNWDYINLVSNEKKKIYRIYKLSYDYNFKKRLIKRLKNDTCNQKYKLHNYKLNIRYRNNLCFNKIVSHKSKYNNYTKQKCFCGQEHICFWHNSWNNNGTYTIKYSNGHNSNLKYYYQKKYNINHLEDYTNDILITELKNRGININ